MFPYLRERGYHYYRDRALGVYCAKSRDQWREHSQASQECGDATNPGIFKFLDKFADVFLTNLPLFLHITRKTDNSIYMVEHAKLSAHLAYSLSTSEEAELKKQP